MVFKNGGRIAAVENVSLDVPAGAFVTLVGPSGCGKSMLFNCIAGFLVPEIGAVIYRGRKIVRPNVGIGYMTQKDSPRPGAACSRTLCCRFISRRCPRPRRGRAPTR